MLGGAKTGGVNAGGVMVGTEGKEGGDCVWAVALKVMIRIDNAQNMFPNFINLSQGWLHDWI